MRLPATAILVLISVTSFAQQTNAPVAPSMALTIGRAVKFRRPSDIHFSPDGSRVICVVSEVNGPTIESHLWLLHVGHGDLQQFTFSPKSERRPQWNPAGGELAFLSNRSGAMQVFVIAQDAGEAQVLTASAAGVSDFRWSPDGRQIVFLAPESELVHADSDPHIIDREQDLARLWIIDLASKKVRRLTSGHWRIDDFEWLRSDRILVKASDQPRSDSWNDALYGISPIDSAATLVAKPNQPFNRLVSSPGHNQFLYVSTRNAGPIPHDLSLQSADGGVARDVTAGIDRAVLEAHWQNENTVLVRVADGFYNRIFRTSLNETAVPIDLPYSVRDFDVRHDGTLIFTAVGFNRLPELFVRRSDGTRTQVSHLQQGWDGIPLADAEIFRIKSFDGTAIEAALMKPAAANDSHKLPLVLLAHGGPAGNFSADYFWFNAWPQLLVSRGYQVLMVNPRGSIGYGEDFVKANHADLGGGDFKDLMAVLDSVIARGNTDPERLGIGGWSYGAEMTQFAVTQTKRFKAAVSGDGVFDETSEFGTEDGPAEDEWYFGTPWENPEVFARNSPLSNIRNAKTPMLIVHGEDDQTNPLGQSLALYRALKHYNVETELVTYPGEGHLPRQERHQIDILERMLAWFDRYLK